MDVLTYRLLACLSVATWLFLIGWHYVLLCGIRRTLEQIRDKPNVRRVAPDERHARAALDIREQQNRAAAEERAAAYLAMEDN